MSRQEELIVTPEYLRQKADEWENFIQRAENSFLEIEKEIANIGNCFLGKTAAAFRRNAAEKKIEGETAFLALKKMPEKLKQIADSYEQAERRNQNVFKGNRNQLCGNEAISGNIGTGSK